MICEKCKNCTAGHLFWCILFDKEIIFYCCKLTNVEIEKLFLLKRKCMALRLKKIILRKRWDNYKADIVMIPYYKLSPKNKRKYDKMKIEEKKIKQEYNNYIKELKKKYGDLIETRVD